ncbi:MAG: hypothetical protein WCL39_07730, partial [Armatimonadota bacterium]
PVSNVKKLHIRMLRNRTFKCEETACFYIRNNKEYYRDNNKDKGTDNGTDDVGATTGGIPHTTGEDLPCDAAVDGSLVELLMNEGVVLLLRQ